MRKRFEQQMNLRTVAIDAVKLFLKCSNDIKRCLSTCYRFMQQILTKIYLTK